MKRLLALAVALFGVSVAPAADPLQPAVELRMKSVVDLLPYIEYGGELAGQNNNVEQVVAIIKEFAKQKMGLEGIDLTKPFGGYVLVTENIADSAIVLMVPASTEEAFLGLLTDRAMLTPKKDDDGSYAMTVPNFPASVHLRFADGYAYLGFRSAAAVAKDKLLSPKDFFAAKSDALLAANVFLDRIPADLRKNLAGQFELHLNDAAKGTDPVEKAFQKFAIDRAAEIAKAVLTEADKLTLAVTADPKADDIGIEFALTPRKGTALAKTLGGWADRPSAAAGVSRANGAAVAAGINFALPSDTKLALGKLLDLAAGAAVQKVDGPAKGLAKQMADVLLPTLKSGELELGAALVGPDAKGKFGGVAALRTVGGGEIKKLAETLAVFVPQEAAKIAFDAEKIGDGQRHAITSGALTQNPKIGADTVHLYTSDALFAATLAPSTDGLKAAVSAKPAKTPMLFVEASAVKLFRLFHEADADKLAKMTEEAFGKPVRDGDDVIRLTGQGGDSLRLKLTAKGRALAFLRVINQ